MARHRGIYKPSHNEPYELSRFRIETFVRCPACFYLVQVKGIEFPSMPGWNLNEATDVLLKRDFDHYRKIEQTHPFLQKNGYGHLIPYNHENFELWTQSMHYGAEDRFHTIHEQTHLKVGGGLDDVWFNQKTGKVHIVDYKSTSMKSDGKTITLDDKWKESYKRQMDLYVWIMRRMGINVSDTGYFLYCDGDRFDERPFLGTTDATMYFKMYILPYRVESTWIEPTLKKINKTLNLRACPKHSKDCEQGKLLKACAKI